MVVGGYVSSIGAGLACPGWPECPPLTSWPIIVEFTHRMLTLTAGLLVLSTTVVTLLYRGEGSLRVKFLATLTFVMLVIQVVVGMLTVFFLLQAEIVTAHLALAILVFSLALLTSVSAWRL